jgi:hypothetical protein
MHAFRNGGWSRTSPTGSVSYVEEEASTATPCLGSASTAACRCERRSPAFDPSPR